MTRTEGRPANRVRRASIWALLSAVGLVVAVQATPASAAPVPDKPEIAAGTAAIPADQTAAACGSPVDFGALCYFYRSNYGGAQAGFVPSISDLLTPTRWLFRPGGDGAGQQVANNAGSAHNRDTACHVTVYFYANHNENGPKITLNRGTSHPTLGVVNNENRSHRFHTCVA